MNYYIKGDPNRAEEIKAAFEKKGVASNADKYNYKNHAMLYFTAGGMIYITDANGSWANIIKTHPDYQELELPKPHYDIANFKPFDKVLTRFGNNDPWRANFFSHIEEDNIEEDRWRYFVGVGYANKQCIPFEGNEHLLGTTDMPSEEYINW